MKKSFIKFRREVFLTTLGVLFTSLIWGQSSGYLGIPNTVNIYNSDSLVQYLLMLDINADVELKILSKSSLQNSGRLIDVKFKNNQWSSYVISYNFQKQISIIDSSKVQIAISYDSLIDKLIECNIYDLRSDSNMYDTINLGSANGYDIPFILPEGGRTYYISAKNLDKNNITYSFYCPETICKNLFDAKIEILDLTNFVKILQLLRDTIYSEF